MKKNLFPLLVAILNLTTIHAQVGIGTTTPDASSILDITASDKGVLVPRINLVDVTNLTTPINSPATGLLIWNTNVTVTGGNGTGFYFFNGAQWTPLTQVAMEDHDFYEEGTTNAPDDIDDNMVTNGRLGINVANPLANFHVTGNETTNSMLLSKEITSSATNVTNSEFNLTGDAPTAVLQVNNQRLVTSIDNTNPFARRVNGIYNQVSGSNSILTGNNTNLSILAFPPSNVTEHVGYSASVSGSGGGKRIGYKANISDLSTNTKIGFDAQLTGSESGHRFGSSTTIQGSGALSETGHYVFFGAGANAPQQVAYRTQIGSHNNSIKKGIDIDIYNSTGGSQYGTYVKLQNGAFGNDADLYGSYITIPNNTNSNVQYGIYSDVRKPIGYAGYFLGRVSLGLSPTNNYILPSIRGTANQIMQTDGSGQVTWVDLPLSSFWSRTGTNLDVATTGDNISFSSDQTSITFPQTTGTPSPMIYMFDGGSNNANRMIFSHSNTFDNWGLQYRDNDDSFRFLAAGTDRVIVNLGTGNPLVVNGNVQATNFISATTTYPDYVFETYYKGTSKLKNDYVFKPLEKVETYIKSYGHLPGVKPYDIIKKAGMTIDLSETSVTNLEKIEELFLYTIELKKENDKLKENQKTLEDRLNKIETLLLKKD